MPGALEALIASGQDLNLQVGYYGRTAFQAALEQPGRRAEVLERLVAAGADPSLPGPFGADPIFCAVGYQHHQTVTPDSERQLFDKLFHTGCNPNAVSEAYGTPILASIKFGNLAEVKVMLDAGSALTATSYSRFPLDPIAGFTPLMLAAPKPAMFQYLLTRGGDPTQSCPCGLNLTEFLQREITRATELADEDDWCRAHAAALSASLACLTKA